MLNAKLDCLLFSVNILLKFWNEISTTRTGNKTKLTLLEYFPEY